MVIKFRGVQTSFNPRAREGTRLHKHRCEYQRRLSERVALLAKKNPISPTIFSQSPLPPSMAITTYKHILNWLVEFYIKEMAHYK